MNTILTLTQEGRIPLTPALRAHLGVAPGDELEVRMMPHGVLLMRGKHQDNQTASFHDFAGSLSGETGVHPGDDALQQAIATAAVDAASRGLREPEDGD